MLIVVFTHTIILLASPTNILYIGNVIVAIIIAWRSYTIPTHFLLAMKTWPTFLYPSVETVPVRCVG